MLEVKNISCGYDGENIIKNISFNINSGDKLCIIGANGCGKTTLLKALCGLLPYSGSIRLCGKQISAYGKKELAKKMALLSQLSAVYFPYTVYDTVALGRYAHLNGVFAQLKKDDREYVLHCIERVGLLGEKDKLISELSGGQLQRVFLARLFAQSPDIILLDEPTNHLDLKYQLELLRYIEDWSKASGKTVVGVMHDLNLARQLFGRFIMLKNGGIFAEGGCEILTDDNLTGCFDVNIRAWMLESLKNWQN